MQGCTLPRHVFDTSWGLLCTWNLPYTILPNCCSLLVSQWVLARFLKSLCVFGIAWLHFNLASLHLLWAASQGISPNPRCLLPQPKAEGLLPPVWPPAPAHKPKNKLNWCCYKPCGVLGTPRLCRLSHLNKVCCESTSQTILLATTPCLHTGWA